MDKDKEKEILQSLILGGTIGAALGSLISNNKNEVTGIGAFAGAVILATLKANENAQKTNVPVYIKEKENIVALSSDGKKRIVKVIVKSANQIPKRFKLE